MKVRAFITHKGRETYSDCKDRFSINNETRAVSISDGMTQSIFSDYWADILSKFYVDNGHCTDDDRKALSVQWQSKVNEYLQGQIAEGKDPWRLRNSIESREGAGATLCGVKFDSSKKWHGHVLGDSCIVEVDLLGKQTPKIYSSEDKIFDCYPDYYDSIAEKEGKGHIMDFSGEIDQNKTLLLVSDPFSAFVQKNGNNFGEWFKRIMSLKTHKAYCELVDEWRNMGLHDDDSTICIIEYDDKEEMIVEFSDSIEDLVKKEKSVDTKDCEEESGSIIAEEEKNAYSGHDVVSDIMNRIKGIINEVVKNLPKKSIKEKDKLRKNNNKTRKTEELLSKAFVDIETILKDNLKLLVL